MTISATTQGIRPGVCLSTAKPANPFDGQVIYMTDVDQTAVWDGTSWVGLDPSRDRNVIINGDMRIDQRNNGASVTPTANQYLVDRWQAALNVASKFSVTQSTTTATKFVNSMLATSLSSYSIGASELCALRQSIEGQNVGNFGWGTANAQTATLSFSVRSSLTGTFGGSIMNSAANRSYPFTYTISNANTFEYKTVTIEGDTSGTWLTTNGIGISILFGLGVGSVFSGPVGAWAGASYYGANGATSVVGTNGATLFVTGVQFELGSVATPFEFEDIGTTLSKCQRYFEKSYNIGTTPGTAATLEESIGLGSYTNTPAIYNRFGSGISFKVPKRATPTVVQYAPASGSSAAASNATHGDGSTAVGYVSAQQINQNGFNLAASVGGSTSTGYFTIFYAYTASAEL